MSRPLGCGVWASALGVLALLGGCSLPDFEEKLANLPEEAPPSRLEGCQEDGDCAAAGEGLICVRLRPDDDRGVCAVADTVREGVGGGAGPGGGEGGGEGEGEPPDPPPLPEVCNGQDEDGDGETDEGFALGESCDDLGICKGGVWECHSGGGRICSVSPGQPGSLAVDEACNRQDDDCDGAVDEGIALAGPDGAELTLGTQCAASGACGGGIVVCHLAGSPGAGAPCCSSDPVCRGLPANTEACDGVDNDCDGTVDEDTAGLGDACPGEQACGEGTLVCAVDMLGACCTTKAGCEPLVPAPDGPVGDDELCDDVDNDCDGAADEGFGVGEACGSGACAEGVQVCSEDGADVLCSTAGNAQDELCNGFDDDCDGAVDEEFGVDGDCGIGACAGGQILCDPDDDDQLATICSSDGQAEAERCDGVDNDCNGDIDEGLGKGDLCDGVGECGRGVRECDGAGGLRCSTDIGGRHHPGDAEACNGLDDDCDGAVPDNELDGDLDGELDCAELAHDPACPAGAEDDPRVGPGATELCDGVDNDCDGDVEEGFDLGAECGFGRCAEGEVICDAADDSGLSTICSRQDRARPEICNGIDDDCDGELPDWDLDDDDDDVRICEGDCNDAHSGIHPFTDEVCNGIDDDCDEALLDAEIDHDGDGYVECASVVEGLMGGDCEPEDPQSFPGAPERCDGINNSCDPDHNPAVTEKDQDDDGWLSCEECNDLRADIHPGHAEICGDGVDNDCNGLPDEVDDADEICDGEDNDCDGGTDERFAVGGLCQGDHGVCSAVAGERECDGQGGVVCSVDVGGSDDTSDEEICNGLDDDCDGDVDEGCDDDDDNFCDLAFEVDEGATCIPGDCDDDRRTVNPDADEICDGLDSDCDGSVGADDLDEDDADGDGFLVCDAAAPDCDDNDPTVYPRDEEDEVCDAKDTVCANDGTPPAAELTDDDDDGVGVCFDCDDDDGDVPAADGYEDLTTGKDDDCDGGADRLSDDFDDESLPQTWRFVRAAGLERPYPDPADGGFLGLAPLGPPGALGQALAPVHAPQGFDAEVRLAIQPGENNTFGGIIFGWSEDGSFAYAALHPPDEVWLGTFTAGLADPVVDRFEDGVRNGGFGPLTLRVRQDAGGDVEVWVDGVRVMQGEGMPAGGRVGLLAKDTLVAFDDLRIRRP